MTYRTGSFQKFLRLHGYVAMMQKGAQLLLETEAGKAQLHWFTLDDSLTQLYWADANGNTRVLDLRIVTDVTPCELLDRPDLPGANYIGESSFAIVTPLATLRVHAETWRDFEVWFQGLAFLTKVSKRFYRFVPEDEPTGDSESQTVESSRGDESEVSASVLGDGESMDEGDWNVQVVPVAKELKKRERRLQEAEAALMQFSAHPEKDLRDLPVPPIGCYLGSETEEESQYGDGDTSVDESVDRLREEDVERYRADLEQHYLGLRSKLEDQRAVLRGKQEQLMAEQQQLRKMQVEEERRSARAMSARRASEVSQTSDVTAESDQGTAEAEELRALKAEVTRLRGALSSVSKATQQRQAEFDNFRTSLTNAVNSGKIVIRR